MLDKKLKSIKFHEKVSINNLCFKFDACLLVISFPNGIKNEIGFFSLLNNSITFFP